MFLKLITFALVILSARAGTKCKIVSGTRPLTDFVIQGVETGGVRFCSSACSKTPACSSWVFDTVGEPDVARCQILGGEVTMVEDTNTRFVFGVCEEFEGMTGENPIILGNGEDADRIMKELRGMRKSVRTMMSNSVNIQETLEMMTRASGGSGVSFARSGSNLGTKLYNRRGAVGLLGIMNIHDHADHDRSLGLGEFSAVLNGIRFGTRHNDYLLWENDPDKPECVKCGGPMELPPIPTEVTELDTVEEQIEEMQEWFKAWQTQNYTVRDYRKYFQPVVVVLEGWWNVITEDDKLEDPFVSDRHAFEASTFESMRSINRYLFAKGGKWISENMGWLPSAFVDINKRGQWMYRLSAKKLPFDVPLQTFRVADDFASRFSSRDDVPTSNKNYVNSRMARFELANRWPDMESTHSRKSVRDSLKDPWRGRAGTSWSPMDDIMYAVPGLDGEKGDLQDISLYSGLATNLPAGKGKLNAARYTRKFAYGSSDATGRKLGPRGINDPFLFVAKTTSSKVIERTMTQNNPRLPDADPKMFASKWSYAVPTEIIWLTPLNSWNPHDIMYHGWERSGSVVSANKRTGKIIEGDDEGNLLRAMNGTAYWRKMLTPREFFRDTTTAVADPADTSRGSVGVLDKNGDFHDCVASGVFTSLPRIPGVKSFQGTDFVRIRYPIPPIHEFSSVGVGETKAFADLFAGHSTMRKMGEEKDLRVFTRGSNWIDDLDQHYGFRLRLDDLEKISSRESVHSHYFDVSPNNVRELLRRGETEIKTSRNDTVSPHTHLVTLAMNQNRKLYVREQVSSRGGSSSHVFSMFKKLF